jgi:hypothetical protein
VNGKKGKFLDRVDDAKLAAVDTSLMTGEGKGLSESSINKGAFTSTGLPMPHTTQAVAALVAQVRAGWTHRDPGPITVHLIGDTTFAARAKPDNSIVVPIGVIARADNDDEVAWVLAHEFTHTSMRHYARTPELIRRQHTAEMLLSIAEAGMDLSDTRSDQSGGTIRFYKVSDPESDKRRNEAWSREQQLRQIILLGDALASREQEDEADVNGYDLARAAGFDADSGSKGALEIAGADDKRAAEKAKSLQESLADSMKKSVSKADVTRAVQGGDIAGAARSVGLKFVTKVVFLGTEQVIGYLSQNHRPAVVRIKGINAYAEAAYASDTSPPPTPHHKWLDGVLSDPEFKEAVVAVNAHDKALIDLDGGDPKKALEDLQPALNSRYRATPLVLNVTAAVYDGLGDFSNADRSYEAAERAGLPPPKPTLVAAAPRAAGASSRGRRVASKPAVAAQPQPAIGQPQRQPTDPFLAQSLSGYNEHILLLVRHDDFARAKAKIAEAEGRFGDHTRFLPALINIAARTKNQPDLFDRLDECLGTEDETLRQECRDAVYDEQRALVDAMDPEERSKLNDKIDHLSNEHRRSTWMEQLKAGVSAPAGQPQGAPAKSKTG